MPVEAEIKEFARTLGASSVAVVEAGEYPEYARQVRERLSDRGFDPRHHTSHRYLRGLESAPRLIPLLDAARPGLIRRNAAICLGNIAGGDERTVRAGADGSLAGYLDWALERADGEEVDRA